MSLSGKQVNRQVLFLLAAISIFLPTSIAQHEKREPLTEAQVIEIREAGLYPADRIRLYTKFLDEKAEKIKALAKRGRSINRTQALDDQLQDFTALMDELGSNLDQYSERKADLRRAMKPLVESSAKWMVILHALAGEPGFDVARKDAIESADEISAEAARIQTEQESYFATHKDERGQERSEPKE
jgi:hypothetical protein